MTPSDPFALDDAPPPPPSSEPLPVDNPPWLSGLNPEQRQAVELTDGPVLVLSGAGTGKTRVLITRLAYILGKRLAQPWQILAVTFTNRAAREMRERVADLVGPMAESLWLGTFHALGVRILRKHGELVGLKSNFTILDSDDQLRLLKQVMEADGIDHKKWPAQVVLSVIQRWKDKGLIPDQVTSAMAGDLAEGRAVDLYRAYQQRLLTLNATDFGDLLLHCLTLFQNHAEVLQEYQSRFRYILVDEYQDTNVAQYLWLRLMCQKHRNLCCVGDDDQSIYSWRGAEVGNILRFEKDFTDAKVVRLERNYRSTPTILAAASALIDHNEDRLGKTLKPAMEVDGEPGAPVTIKGVWDGPEEARWVVEEIEALQTKDQSLSSMAILVRAGFQMLEFEERFITTGVPYRVVGGPRFYERLEIRDAIAYLRCITAPTDDLAFERIVNKPKRSIGDTTVQKIHVYARSTGLSLMEAALRLTETDELRAQTRKALTTLIGDMSRWRSLRDGLSPADLAAQVLDESGYTEMWQKDTSPEAAGRLENLKEFVGGLEEWDTIGAFLEHVSLVMENDSKAGDEAVTIMTLHGAKGLEFDTVFLPGWEEEIFPHRRALDDGGGAAVEEERRLAYVGLTRARKKVNISYAANRRVYNQWQASLPSRFIGELPDEHIENISDNGLMGSFGEGRAEGFSDGWNSGSNWSSKRGRKAPVIDGDSWQVEARKSEGGYSVGMRIFHQKFGYGIVQAVDDTRLEIAFDKAGDKKVLDSFVEPA
ncbi:MAG: UvrD-helicase domain-containing protein [Rhodospirillaceae bacterium]|jgi:DNA helicase II / ATP-dependent DNA helicase PcrA|nr:UvrD-helicase domain-containing protein [Rhodospirillaceae bacterium]MBT5566848.1 UvrD-helicase domain-containing protein [Rhodospirillaceae bacterium]MBT6089036.1 UvrD-helicase domain-containing protein [Rhodospirillaceae bacterium]MBT7451345.1 UvrD-helicase domain-containing protein [Rhodospirillaceae bacterium]